MNQEWFRDFFSGAAVDFWMAAAPSPADDIEFLTSVFGAPARQNILDVACGAGRHSIPLALAGYAVTGVDISPDFLRHAATAAAAARVSVDWKQCDMRDLPDDSPFDGVLCFGNSFGYIGREESRDVVRAISRVLNPGGAFVLETGAAAESLLPALQTRRWMEFGDVLAVSNAKYDVIASRLDVEYTFVRRESRQTKIAHTFIFTIAELREMLENAGLTMEGVYRSTRRELFELGSPRALIVARK